MKVVLWLLLVIWLVAGVLNVYAGLEVGNAIYFVVGLVDLAIAGFFAAVVTE